MTSEIIPANASPGIHWPKMEAPVMMLMNVLPKYLDVSRFVTINSEITLVDVTLVTRCLQVDIPAMISTNVHLTFINVHKCA